MREYLINEIVTAMNMIGQIIDHQDEELELHDPWYVLNNLIEWVDENVN